MPASSPNIEIRIHGLNRETNTYLVGAQLDDGSQFQNKLNARDARIRLESGADPATYGPALFDILFHGQIRDAYNQAVGRAQDGDARVRMRLHIEDDAAELHAIPWEGLYHQPGRTPVPLAAGSSSVFFSRYLSLQRPESPPIDLTNEPLRILFAIANPRTLPQGADPIRVDDEVNAILDVLDDLGARRQVEATFLCGVSGLRDKKVKKRFTKAGHFLVPGSTSLERVGDLLAEKKPHILHVLAHGRFWREDPVGPGTAALYLENEDGSYARVEDDRIVGLLQTIESKPHLVFLAACESAATGATEEHPQVGLAPKLVAAGIPAVVAMQDAVEMSTARRFARDFYRGLLDHGSVDQAVNEARTRLVSLNAGSGEWAKPVLLMRLQHGQLFTGTVHAVLKRMLRNKELRLFGSEDFIDLGVRVIRLTGDQALSDLDRLPPDPSASVDLMDAITDVFDVLKDPARRCRLAVLVGRPGSNKTTQVKRIAWQCINHSLDREPDGGSSEQKPLPTIVPVYVPLQSFEQLSKDYSDPLEALILGSLKPFWELSELPKPPPVFRLLFDDDGSLSDEGRVRVIHGISSLMNRYPGHQYVFAATPDAYEWEELRLDPKINQEVLVIQPLDRHRIRHLLWAEKEEHPEAARRLLDVIYQSELFDVAQSPSFMVQMIKDARQGRIPRSRCDAVHGLFDDKIQSVSPGQDSRAQTEQTLFRLAWEMKHAGREAWPLDAVFGVMAEARGRRCYDLETLYREMLAHGLLAWAGEDAIEFNYAPVQDYCCAQAILKMPQRDRVLRDIVATLGLPEWLDWWKEVLVFLCGLMTAEPAGLRRLLEGIIYGLDPLQGEQIFLAARCLLECMQYLPTAGSDAGARQPASPNAADELQTLVDELRPYVVNALRWRTVAEKERKWTSRERAVRLLAALAGAEAVVDLTRLAVGRVRLGMQGEPKTRAQRGAAGCRRDAQPNASR